jgi:hypothetical protein
MLPRRLTLSPMSRFASRPHAGLGRVLVAVYGVLAIAAVGRSVFQIIDRFEEAPIAFTLSAVAAVVYVLATLSLAFGWDRVAWITISFELVGVLVIGAISVLAPAMLGLDEINPFGREATVWSVFGAGYLFIPLVLPILGILWLRSRRETPVEAAPVEARTDA